MDKLEHIRKAIDFSSNMGDNYEVSDVVCVASHMIALCMVQYGFKGDVLDGAINAINEDIKDSMKFLGDIVEKMKKEKN